MGTPVVPVTLGELRTRVEHIVANSATFSPDELDGAINHGYRRMLRALRSVRSQPFQSYVDNFALDQGQAEVDISRIDPPIWRISQLVSPPIPATLGANATQFVTFEYKDSRDPDFRNRELGAFTTTRVLYDVIEGRLPVRVDTLSYTATVASVVGSGDEVVLSGLPATIVPYVGQEVAIVGAGPKRVIEGDGMEPTANLPSDYFGRVTSWASGTATLGVTPRLSDTAVTGAEVTLYASKMLRLAPAMPRSVTGRLYYTYRPARLIKASDAISALLSEHDDAIVAYAASWLLRSTNDADSDRWMLEGQEMRSEALQDLDPLVDENTEGLSSDLFGLGDW